MQTAAGITTFHTAMVCTAVFFQTNYETLALNPDTTVDMTRPPSYYLVLPAYYFLHIPSGHAATAAPSSYYYYIRREIKFKTLFPFDVLCNLWVGGDR